MKAPNFQDVAIFVLGTTRTEPNRAALSSLSGRMLPLMQTWGGYFASIYFVFGTNQVDFDFVHSPACHPAATHSRRQLRASSPQVAGRNATELFSCRQDSVDLNVLFVGNCTGEYFGHGPVCRCQESLRYYLTRQHHSWFAFMDDDLYLRPYSLLALLGSVRDPGGDSVYALVSSQAYRSFQFSSRWRTRGGLGAFNCKVPSAHNFPVAMPAFLPRATVETLRSALDSNGLTRLQETWGGSGDALLGMLLWMYEIPVLSFARAYTEAAIAANEWNMWPFNRTQIVAVHKVKNIRNITTKRGLTVSMPGQHDVCRFFGDRPYLSPSIMPDTAQEQTLAGRRAAAEVFALQLGSIRETVFRRVDIRKQWQDFTFADCALAT